MMLIIDKEKGTAVRECIGSGVEEFDLLEGNGIGDAEYSILLYIERLDAILKDPDLTEVERKAAERTKNLFILHRRREFPTKV